METPTRPWQGTVLGVFDIIGVVFAFLFAILFLFPQGMIATFLGGAASGVDVTGSAEATAAVGGLMGMLASLGIVVGIVMIGIGILLIFMARGAFKGQKWSAIVSIIFAVLGLVSALANLNNGIGSVAFSLLLNLFTGYCAFMCIKSPFFGPKQ